MKKLFCRCLADKERGFRNSGFKIPWRNDSVSTEGNQESKVEAMKQASEEIKSRRTIWFVRWSRPKANDSLA
jgi:hypothetical protein